MATGTIQGIGASVTRGADLDQWNLKENSFSATINYGIVETSGFEDAGNKTFGHTSIDCTGTITGTGESGGTGDSPFGSPGTLTLGTEDPTGTLTLQYNTSCTLAFTAFLTAIASDRPWDGKMTLTHSFQSSGALTVAWVEA